MKKIYVTILLIVFAVLFASAQQPITNLNGYVVNKETGAPVAGQTMYCMLDSLNSAYYNKAVTNEKGFYSFYVPFRTDTTKVSFTVYTYDCNGSIVSGAGTYMPGNGAITINLSICGVSNTQCKAFFKYLPTHNNGLDIAFYDGSQYLSGSESLKYAWNFGDSTSSGMQNPVHTFNKPGLNNVCLSISSSNKLCISTICLPVTVGSPMPGPCESSFSYYLDSLSKKYVFEVLAINQQATELKWDFGDGTSASGQKVTHIYNDTNSNHTVCLTAIVAGANGTVCSSASCQVLFTYIPLPCESSFWFRQDSASETDFIFEGISKNNQISSWNWDFGDGSTATGQKVMHLFADKKGIHTVCLYTAGIDSDDSACTYSICQNVYFYQPSPCESSFQYYADSTGSKYFFEGYAKNSQVDTWMWEFGDGTTATGQKVSHSFSMRPDANASHYVCLTTTINGADGVDCKFNSCQEIYTDIPSLCENYFKAYTQDGFTYAFSGSVASGIPAYYFWDFGDGTSATGQTATHTFANTSPTPILYTNSAFSVCLTTIAGNPTIYDTCKSISCQMIFVGVDNPQCKAVFSAIQDSSKFTYRFQNQSQKKYSYAFWDFGDSEKSFEVDDVHTYSSPGIYMACLTVIDSIANCKDQACKEIWIDVIQPDCQASFTVVEADSSNIKSFGYLFYNTSASRFTSQEWSFGDGIVSNEQNPVHFYDLPGVYNTCLTIWDSLGKCQNTYCRNLFVGKVINENTVSGIVLAGNKVADQGIVWLVSPDNSYNTELLIDSTGIYHFTGVPYGKYYIYAMLTPGSHQFFAYMPTYYASSLSWQGATMIFAGEPNAWYVINLVPSMAWSQGDATIAGTINWGGMILRAESNPAANVEVVLYNSAGNPIAYTFTDNDGTYIFENLPYGYYTVQAEMTGKSSQSIPVNLTENSTTANISFVVNSAAIDMTGITELNKSVLLAGSPYPNPVREILNIKMNASASGSAEVDIMDVQGRIIQTEYISLTGSNNLFSIATGSLTKGIYLVRVKSDGYKPVVRKFVK